MLYDVKFFFKLTISQKSFLIISALLLILSPFKLSSQTFEDYNKFKIANAFINDGEVEKGIALLEDLLKKYPDNYQFYEAAQKAYLQIKLYDKAILLIESFLKKYPQNLAIYGQLGGAYYLKGNYEKAYQIWDEGLSKVPQNSSNFRTMANFAIERRAFSKAIEYLQKAKKISENYQHFAFEIANLYSILMMYDEATKEYCDLILTNPELIYSVQGSMAQYLSRNETIESAISIVKSYDSKYDKIEFKLLLSFLFENLKDFDNALKLLDELDKKQKRNGEDLFRFAENRLRDKNFSAAQKAYELAETNSKNPSIIQRAKIGSAKTFYFSLKNKNDDDFDFVTFDKLDSLQKIQFNQAIEKFRNIVRLYPNTDASFEALYYIGEIYFYYLQNFYEAEKIFSDLIRNYSYSYFGRKAWLYFIESLIKSTKFEQAANEINKFLKLGIADDKDKSKANYLSAKINIWRNDIENAKKAFKELLSTDNNDYSNDAIECNFLLNLISLDSLAIIEYISGDYFFTIGEYKKASEKFKEAAKTSKFPFVKSKANISYAKSLIANRQYSEAKEFLDKQILENKNDLFFDEILYLLGALNLKNNEIEKAKQNFKTILVNYPNSLYLFKARQKLSELAN